MYQSNLDQAKSKAKARIETLKAEAQEEINMIEKVSEIVPENLWGDDDLMILKGVVRKDKIRVIVKLDSLPKIASWIISLPPTEETQELRYAGKENTEIASPYLIELKNPVKPNKYHGFSAKIQFIHRELNLELEFPAELISDCLTSGSRKITSSEYHYFAGEISRKNLDEMAFRTYEFRSGSARYYGGVRKASNPSEIDSIIDYIKK